MLNRVEKLFTLPISNENERKTYIKNNWFIWLLERENVRLPWNKIKFHFDFTKHKKRRELEYLIIEIKTWWTWKQNKFRAGLKYAGRGSEIRKWNRICLESRKQKKKKKYKK